MGAFSDFSNLSAFTGSMWTICQNDAKRAITHKSVSMWMVPKLNYVLFHANQVSGASLKPITVNYGDGQTARAHADNLRMIAVC